MSKRILLIRHGQTTTNTKGLIHKRDTIETLDETGKEQAIKLVKVCRENNIEAVYTSPETRAFNTAEIISNGLSINLKPIVIKNLHERSWGNWEGKPWQDVQKILEGMSLDERYTFVPPGGESWQQMEERLDTAIQTIIKHNYKTVAIVTHGGSLRGLMPVLEGSSKESSFQYNFDNASVTIFDYKDNKFIKVTVNNTSHL